MWKYFVVANHQIKRRYPIKFRLFVRTCVKLEYEQPDKKYYIEIIHVYIDLTVQELIGSENLQNVQYCI